MLRSKKFNLTKLTKELNQREGERGNRSKSLLENTNMTECTQEIGYLQSINPTYKHLSQLPFTCQFF
jgi:hypothetical protein